MGTAGVLEIPKETEPVGPTLQGTDLVRPQVVNIVVEGRVFELPPGTSIGTPSVLGRLRRTADGLYALPNEWGVHSIQFSVLSDLLHSTK